MSLPIDQRAASSECVGQELNLQSPEAGGLQPPGPPVPSRRIRSRSRSHGWESTHLSGPARSDRVAEPAEGEGVEPSRLIARPVRVGCRRRSACPSVRRSSGGRNRTCELLFNREAHVPAHATPVYDLSVGAAGFEPAFSWSRTRRIARLSHAPNPHSECPAGVEPALPPWQGGRLPLHHGHDRRRRIVKEAESTGWDSNPRRRITGAVSSPLDDQCRIPSGTRGARTLTCPVKSRYAAANTWSRTIDRVGPGGVEPPSRGYQPLVLPLNHEPSAIVLAFGAGGVEPPSTD